MCGRLEFRDASPSQARMCLALSTTAVSPFSSKEANMGRTPFVLALSLTLAVSTRSLAQQQSPSPRPHLAEVRFADGSIVRMTLLQDDLEVQTKYGKLTIRLNEIRRVE